MTLIALTLPLRLVSEANRASSEHWRKRQRRAKEQQALVHMAMAARVPPGLVEASGGLTVTMTRLYGHPQRAYDDDNCVGAMKHIRDGIAKVLGINDRDARVRWCCEQRRVEKHGFGVEIRVEARGA